jgi:hypothetical protein
MLSVKRITIFSEQFSALSHKNPLEMTLYLIAAIFGIILGICINE